MMRAGGAGAAVEPAAPGGGGLGPGQAYVMKHDFVSAASFYEEAIKAQPRRMALRLSLAELYRNMGRADKALAALEGVYREAGEAETLEALMLRGKALRIEARVHQRADPADPTNYLDALNRARAVQDRLLGRLRGEAADLVKQQRQVAAAICSELAQVPHPPSPSSPSCPPPCLCVCVSVAEGTHARTHARTHIVPSP